MRSLPFVIVQQLLCRCDRLLARFHILVETDQIPIKIHTAVTVVITCCLNWRSVTFRLFF